MPSLAAAREAVHQGIPDLRGVRHPGGDRQGAPAARSGSSRAATWSSTRPRRWSRSTSTPGATSARRRAAGSRTRSSRPTSRRSRKSSGRSGCAISAGSSSSTSSTWKRRRTGRGSSRRSRRSCAKTASPSKALQVSDFGLVIVTRKRVKQSLERQLTEPCPYCSGSGSIKSSATICFEILTELRKIGPELDGHGVLLRVNPDIARALKEEESAVLRELQQVARQAGDDPARRAPASRAVRRDGGLGLGEVDEVVGPALVDPEPHVVAALERLDLRAA